MLIGRVSTMKASYWSQEVSKMLNIGASTLRRWSLAMEQKGYQFQKDENGRRRFYERDVAALRSIKEISEQQGSTIDEAINAVLKQNDVKFTPDPNMLIERSEDVAQLALSIQNDMSTLQEASAKAHVELLERFAKIEEKLDQIAATKEEPGIIRRFLRRIF
jgi:DNA-binding transcriptional MerR regulator